MIKDGPLLIPVEAETTEVLENNGYGVDLNAILTKLGLPSEDAVEVLHQALDLAREGDEPENAEQQVREFIQSQLDRRPFPVKSVGHTRKATKAIHLHQREVPGHEPPYVGLGSAAHRIAEKSEELENETRSIVIDEGVIRVERMSHLAPRVAATQMNLFEAPTADEFDVLAEQAIQQLTSITRNEHDIGITAAKLQQLRVECTIDGECHEQYLTFLVVQTILRNKVVSAHNHFNSIIEGNQIDDIEEARQEIVRAEIALDNFYSKKLHARRETFRLDIPQGIFTTEEQLEIYDSSTALDVLERTLQQLPFTPETAKNIAMIEDALEQQETSLYRDVTKIAVLMHVLSMPLGQNELNLGIPLNDAIVFDTYRIQPELMDLNVVINLIALAHNLVYERQSSVENEPHRDGKENIFSYSHIELPTGPLLFSHNHSRTDEASSYSVAGGNIDKLLISVARGSRLHDTRQHINIIESQHDWDTYMDHVTSRSGHGQTVDTSKRKLCPMVETLYENQSLKVPLCRIKVLDYKFQVGDGGGDYIDIHNIGSYTEHAEQMRRYLFFTIGAIAMSRRSSSDRSRPLTLDEICTCYEALADCENIIGVIRYLTIEGVREVPVSFQNVTDLREFGTRFLDRYCNQQMKRALDIVTRRIVSVAEQAELPYPEPPKLPKQLQNICEVDSHNGRIYLCLSDLQKVIDAENTHTIKERLPYGIQYLKDENVHVLWVKQENVVLRIAIHPSHGVSITSMPKGVHVRGSIRIDRQVSDRTDQSLLFFRTEILREMKKRNLLTTVQRSSDEMSGKYIDWFGKIENIVEGKPVVVVFNPMTGHYSIDMQLLERAVKPYIGKRNIENGNILALMSLYAFLAGHIGEAGKYHQSVMCPHCGHENTKSEAAAAYIDNETGEVRVVCYGKCSGAGYQIVGINHTNEQVLKKLLEAEPHLFAPITLESYTPVSEEVSFAMNRFHKLAKDLGALDRTGDLYLTRRLLDPQVLPKYGYIPPVVGDAISEVLKPWIKGGLWSLTGIMRKGMITDLSMHSIVDVIDMLQTAKEHEIEIPGVDVSVCLRQLQTLLPEQSCFNGIIRELSLYELCAMWKCGLFRTHAGKSELSGRAVFECHVLEVDEQGPSLKLSGMIARGVDNPQGIAIWNRHPPKLDKDTGQVKDNGGDGKYVKQVQKEPPEYAVEAIAAVFEDTRHGTVEQEKEKLLDTPIGFTFLSPGQFLPEVQQKRVLVVTEGVLTATALGQILPEYKNVIFAANGLGRDQLFAMVQKLRQLYGDDIALVFAYDFDKAGAGQYEKYAEIARLLEIGYQPIHHLFPAVPGNDHIDRSCLPPYDVTALEDAGIKLDFNDLLKQQPFSIYAYREN